MSIQTNSHRERILSLKDATWFAPINVFYHYGVHLDSLPKDQKTSKAFRKADELLVAATALLGIQKSESAEYWIQPVSDQEQSPDVRTGHWFHVEDGRADDFDIQDIEVVTFMPRTNETLTSFLKRTKLSDASAYDSKTVVLCHMLTGAPMPTPVIVEELKKTNAVCPVVVLGRTHPTEKRYVLLQVFPQYKVIAEYDVMDLLNQQTHSGILNVRRGVKPKNERRPEEKRCPFESMGFACSVLSRSALTLSPNNSDLK